MLISFSEASDPVLSPPAVLYVVDLRPYSSNRLVGLVEEAVLGTFSLVFSRLTVPHFCACLNHQLAPITNRIISHSTRTLYCYNIGRNDAILSPFCFLSPIVT